MTEAERAGVEHRCVGARRRRTDAEYVGVKRGSTGVRQAGGGRADPWAGAVRIRVKRDEATRRGPKALAAASESPRARFLFVSGARVVIKPGVERALTISIGCVDLKVRSRTVYPDLVDDTPYFTCNVGDADDSARDPRVVSRTAPTVSQLAAVAEEDGWARYKTTGSERPGSEDTSSENADSGSSKGSGSKEVSSEHANQQRADPEGTRCQNAWSVSTDFTSVPLAFHL